MVVVRGMEFEMGRSMVRGVSRIRARTIKTAYDIGLKRRHPTWNRWQAPTAVELATSLHPPV